jgi:hypothetical protein
MVNWLASLEILSTGPFVLMHKADWWKGSQSSTMIAADEMTAR